MYCGKSGHYANKYNQAPKSSKKASLNATEKDELPPRELKKIVKEVGMLQRNDEDPIFSYHSDSEVDEADFDYCESDPESGPSMHDYSGADEDFLGPTFQRRSGPSMPRRKGKRSGNL